MVLFVKLHQWIERWVLIIPNNDIKLYVNSDSIDLVGIPNGRQFIENGIEKV